jgi:hypothetical protein
LADPTTDGVIILFISGEISTGLLLFSIIRIMEGDVPVATLNTVAIICTLSMFLHGFITNKAHIARWDLSALSVLVMVLTIYLRGHEQVLWIFPALTTIFFLLPADMAAVICLVFMIGVMAMM